MKKKTILIMFTLIAALAVSGIVGSEYYTAQPQFCGSCHNTIEKSYDSWTKSGHEDVKCIDCHFAPGKKSFIKARVAILEELYQNFAVTAEAEVIHYPFKAINRGCTTSECHPKEKPLYRKVNFAENIPKTHKPHKNLIIEGKILNCGTCHSNVKSGEDYTSSQEACYLCNGLNHILEIYF